MIKDVLIQKMKEQGEGFRCSDLARKTKIPHETLLQILKGNTKNPGIYTIAKIANVLRSSLDEFVGNIPKSESVNVKIKNPALFLEIMNFVLNSIRNHTQEFDSSDLFNIILRLYSYSKDSKLDKGFANLYIRDHFLKKDY